MLLTLLMVFSTAVPAFAEGELAGTTELPADTVVSAEPAGDAATSAPEAVETPVPEVVETPAPEVVETPAPEVVETPVPEVVETPVPEVVETPVPEVVETPVPEVVETPVPEVTETPVPEESPEPSPEADEGIMLANMAPPASTGQVDLSIASAMDLGTWAPVFTVRLTAEGVDHTLEMAVGAAQSFVDLPAGTYTLTVSAQGFATYTQTLTVGQSEGLSVQLEIGRRSGYGDRHPGVLLVGDVNGDGVLDGTDKTIMMQAVNGEVVEGFTNLNGDTRSDGGPLTNLADAELLAKSLALTTQPDLVTASVEKFIPEKSISTATTTDVVAIDLETVLQDNGVSAILKRQNNEPITEQTPVDLVFSLGDGAKAEEVIVEGTNINTGLVEITCLDEAGNESVVWGQIDPVGVSGMPLFAMDGAPTVSVSRNANGDIVVDLGGQVAVKRVSFRITGTTGSNNLAEISQVEFVNDMAGKITEPMSSVPEDLAVTGGNEEFTVTWSEAQNITGYEVKVTAEETEEIFSLAGTSLTVTRFGGDDVKNYTPYTVFVRSVNGAWQSEWSGSVEVTPKPTGKPDKPDNVSATGGFESVSVQWKAMKSTQWYNLYYKEESAEQYTKIPHLEVTNYVITGLDSSKPTNYVLYVTGENEFGESDPSLPAGATTATLNPPDMPRYNLINQTNDKPGSTHITAVTCNTGASRFNSAADTAEGTAWCTVDGDAASYYERLTWDDGGFNWLGDNVGVTYTFDQTYTMDTIAIMVPTGMAIGYAKIHWWDESGADHRTEQGVVAVQSRQDAKGVGYYFLRLPGPITTNKIQIGLSRGWVLPNSVSMSEVYFYNYDPLKQELMSLYTDDLHTTLRDDVTDETLNELETRINSAVDQYGNENPDKDLLLTELKTARDILAAQKLSRVTRIHDGITASGDEHGFGGLNAWQPLGVVAAAGDKLTVYVSHNYLTTGSSTNLDLVLTQYHAEANGLSAVVVQKLKVGPNEVVIPKFSTSKPGIETGGALYVQYNGGSGAGDSYAVRVVGGVQVPVLDLYKVTDPAVRLSRTQEYLTELQSFASGMSALHAEKHQGGETPNPNVNYDYDERNCILGSSDIMLDTMMLSIPAQQIVSGCGGSAQTLLNSLNAMENMMALFYQHKGLNAAAPSVVDQIPQRHLNIRYMRMFSGAFMYASGDHIGIEWPETAGMAGCGGVTASAEGLWQAGNYFGWGIAHEIGHDINQGIYAIAEVTNNYFAVLAQAHDDNGSVRFEYPKVYEKVTSGTKGSATNVFTQLGMYWQLHLAYDKGYNYKTYDNYDEQLDNLFWARVDTYARTPSRAPKPKDVALTLEGADRDQALMRLCCAAAERNLLDFFERWGKTPDEGTIAYAIQFPKETRAIYYVNDDARRYTMQSSAQSVLAAEGTTDAIAAVTAAIDPNQSNKVDITVTPGDNVPAGDILGYEIVRCTISGGVPETKTVGFTTTGAFSDVILAMNNRTVSYKVTLVDKYLNRSAAKSTDMVKINHQGQLDKSHWTVAVSGLTSDPVVVQGTEEDPDSFQQTPEMHDASVQAVDGKVETVYAPLVEADGAVIEIDFHETQTITGFIYTAGGGTPIGGYAAQVCQNGEWTTVDEGTLGGSKTVYFANADKAYVSTYAAEGMRLILTGQSGQTVSVAELDVMGLSGDNADFRYAETGEPAIGYLSADYVYDAAQNLKIPAGSLVFTGQYKGNAGYNVVVLYDQNGNMVQGVDQTDELVSDQIILAPDPGEGMIEDTADGVWIYWIEPQYLKDFVMPVKVRAELYRVNNAQTNEGQRLVSDTLFVNVPSPPCSITLGAEG